MNQLSTPATTARESARGSDGKFGHQHRAEATGLSLTVPGLSAPATGEPARRTKAAEQAKARRAEREQEEAQAAAELTARRESFVQQHPDVIAELEQITGEFGASLREQLQTHGQLSEKQVATVRRIALERAEAPGPAPVVQGRGPVSGTVISTKWVENDYGGSLKMVVRDDRGFKVYGTVPSSLREARPRRGDRIRFTTTCEASTDDETFGFFQRPVKASLIGPLVPETQRTTPAGSLTGTPLQVEVVYAELRGYRRVPSGETTVVDVARLLDDAGLRKSLAGALRAGHELTEEDYSGPVWGRTLNHWDLRGAVGRHLDPEDSRDFSMRLVEPETPLLEWLDDNPAHS